MLYKWFYKEVVAACPSEQPGASAAGEVIFAHKNPASGEAGGGLKKEAGMSFTIMGKGDEGAGRLPN